MESYSLDSPHGQMTDIEKIRLTVEVTAKKRAGDAVALLALLRQLEELHRDVRETLFQESLPSKRQHLYHFLRDIEVNGGWPHIQRMKLAELLHALESPTQENEPEE